ncbi:hypothetical protein [Solimonas soli]|uniref:hypothetical protein n=1 Tax=Solimonas soli TaxID=413479 RepID=UPI000486C6A0|nr:hypothetical protein [Solimonas soli]
MAKVAKSSMLFAALLAGGVAQAQAPPLTAAALRACATQVQQLRSGAAQLNRQVAEADARRERIDAQGAALRQEAAQLDREHLQAQLDLQQRRRRHNDEAAAFNAQMLAQRRAIDELNRVKADYARQCAERSYRRSDFAALSPDAQAAMRAGLDDIVVPYVEPAPVR